MEKQTPRFAIRAANESDCGLILELIKALADYEHMSDMVVATEEKLHEALFIKKQAEVIIGEEDGKPVTFALFFYNFSTFLGRANLYLEDLFILEECRGRGYGKQMFKRLAEIALERGCERLDWSCLDWNEPSIGFYRHMGAVALDEWTMYRLEAQAIKALALGTEA